jgi:RNA polymerase sigma-70 factor (ECF subfamily)
MARGNKESSYEEEALVSAAKSGHEWAFVELYARTRRQVFATVFRMTRHREDAEDVLQESIMKTYIHLERFNHHCSFRTWLTRIAINCTLMKLRDERACKEISADASYGEDKDWRPLEFVDRSPSPEDRYAQCEDAACLQSAISNLPRIYRDPIESHYASDRSMKEIADMNGISVAATKARLFHARRVLRSQLK